MSTYHNARPGSASNGNAATGHGDVVNGKNGRPTIGSAISFWDRLTVEEQVALIAVAKESTFREGEVLWREGQPADHVVVIRNGWTKVCHDRIGAEPIVAWRGPGHLLGECAALRSNVRSATVTAVTDLVVLTVPTTDFAALLERMPRVREVVERQAGQRLTETAERTSTLGSSDLAKRMAERILQLLTGHVKGSRVETAMVLPVSVRDLADAVNVQEEVVARMLRAWQEGGVVRSFDERRADIDIHQLRQAFDEFGGAYDPGRSRVLWTGQNCSILLTDIAGFGAENRSHEDRRVVRSVMYRILEESCEKSGTSWESCHCEDRGDGALIVVPPTRPTNAVVDMVYNHVAAGLRAHNEAATEATRIQLRAALHVGPVVSDNWGVTGEALIHAARMLDAKKLKQRLAGGRADLGFITSTFVYDNVIKHGTGGVSSVGYEQVRFQVKEAKSTAWMYFSGPETG